MIHGYLYPVSYMICHKTEKLIENEFERSAVSLLTQLRHRSWWRSVFILKKLSVPNEDSITYGIMPNSQQRGHLFVVAIILELGH